MAFLREHAEILRRTGWIALVFMMVGALNDQFITSQLAEAMTNETGPGFYLVSMAFASLMNSLLFPTLAAAFLFFGLSRSRGSHESFPQFTARVPQQSLIETLRAWGSTLAWGILLVIPGVIRLVQLLYVPLIVVFLKSYQTGGTDALAASSRYAKQRPFSLLGYVLIFTLILPLTITSLTDPWRSYAEAPFGAFLCTLLDLVLLTLSLQILYRLFEKIRQELGDESLLSVERHS